MTAPSGPAADQPPPARGTRPAAVRNLGASLRSPASVNGATRHIPPADADGCHALAVGGVLVFAYADQDCHLRVTVDLDDVDPAAFPLYGADACVPVVITVQGDTVFRACEITPHVLPPPERQEWASAITGAAGRAPLGYRQATLAAFRAARDGGRRLVQLARALAGWSPRRYCGFAGQGNLLWAAPRGAGLPGRPAIDGAAARRCAPPPAS